MKPEAEQIERVVIESVRQLAEDFEIDALRQADGRSVLYGEGGPLDSMALVNLIADLEEAVDAEWGCSIALADERAMSARRSPFRDVASLCEAVAERLAQ
jgi:acyl carrier protein